MAGVASSDMIPRDIEYRVKVGDRKTLTLTLTDENNCAVSLACTCIYNSGTWKVNKPCGGSVFCGAITYSCRAAGQITYTLGACDAVVACTGIWAGEVEYINMCSVISDHSKTFRFVIEPSY